MRQRNAWLRARCNNQVFRARRWTIRLTVCTSAWFSACAPHAEPALRSDDSTSARDVADRALAQRSLHSEPLSFVKASTHTVRVVTWNVGANSVVTPQQSTVDAESETRPAAFARVMRALQPDIVCLQEYTAGAARAAATFDALLPIAGRTWASHAVLGNVLLSRYALTQRAAHTLRRGLSWRGDVIARVGVPESIAAAMPLVACAHLQAKGGRANARFRRDHAGRILRDIDARAASDTAMRSVLIMGDFNAIDGTPAAFLLPQNAARFRMDVRDSHPLHNGIGPDSYTWRDNTQRFAPGVLDYILFTPGSVTVRQGFVLNTASLEPGTLAAHGLRAGDALRVARRGVYDHLPVVLDVEFGR